MTLGHRAQVVLQDNTPPTLDGGKWRQVAVLFSERKHILRARLWQPVLVFRFATCTFRRPLPQEQQKVLPAAIEIAGHRGGVAACRAIILREGERGLFSVKRALILAGISLWPGTPYAAAASDRAARFLPPSSLPLHSPNA